MQKKLREMIAQLVIVINEINLVMKIVDSGHHLLDQRMIEGEIILFPQLVTSCFISSNTGKNILRKILTVVFMFSKPFRRYRKIGENQS